DDIVGESAQIALNAFILGILRAQLLEAVLDDLAANALIELSQRVACFSLDLADRPESTLKFGAERAARFVETCLLFRRELGKLLGLDRPPVDHWDDGETGWRLNQHEAARLSLALQCLERCVAPSREILEHDAPALFIRLGLEC